MVIFATSISWPYRTIEKAFTGRATRTGGVIVKTIRFIEAIEIRLGI